MYPDDNDQELNTDDEYWSKVPIAVRGTMVGHYIASRQSRWLIAIFCYGAAYVGIGILLILAFSNIRDPGEATHILNKGRWVLVAASALICVGSISAERINVGFLSGVLCFLMFIVFTM